MDARAGVRRTYDVEAARGSPSTPISTSYATERRQPDSTSSFDAVLVGGQSQRRLDASAIPSSGSSYSSECSMHRCHHSTPVVPQSFAVRREEACRCIIMYANLRSGDGRRTPGPWYSGGCLPAHIDCALRSVQPFHGPEVHACRTDGPGPRPRTGGRSRDFSA